MGQDFAAGSVDAYVAELLTGNAGIDLGLWAPGTHPKAPDAPLPIYPTAKQLREIPVVAS